MILTCPNCYSQFKVSLAVIGNRGRDVRCSACGEVWHEDDHVVERVEKAVDTFENEEVKESGAVSSDDIFEIPDAIKPLKDDGTNNTNSKGTTQEKRIAYYVAACVFLIILAYLLFSSTSMMRSHPSTQAFYTLFGIHMDVPASDKVTFANIKANDVDGSIKVGGDIVNLTGDPQNLLMMEITVSDGSDQVIAQWYATPPKGTLEPEETVKFISEHHLKQNGNSVESEHGGIDEHGLPELEHENDHAAEGDEQHTYENKYVRVRFVLSPAFNLSPVKTDEEDDGNNPTLHGGESDHPSGHGASL